MMRWLPKQLYLESPYDPATPLLATEPKELKAGTQTNARTCTCVAGLFTITKTWKHPKCLSAGEWTQNVVHPDSGIALGHTNG